MKKIKEKYKDQDEEERLMKMEILQVSLWKSLFCPVSSYSFYIFSDSIWRHAWVCFLPRRWRWIHISKDSRGHSLRDRPRNLLTGKRTLAAKLCIRRLHKETSILIADSEQAPFAPFSFSHRRYLWLSWSWTAIDGRGIWPF